jgi:hypothetical protein
MTKISVKIEIPDGWELVSEKMQIPKHGEHYLSPAGHIAKAEWDFDKLRFFIVREKPEKPEGNCVQEAYAYQDSDGKIDLDSIAESYDDVRTKVLATQMGWRYFHLGRYSQEEAWERLMEFGSVIKVEVKKC